ncbi:Beta-N-acetylglucosaminidase [Clostridium cavendishii DSM 21758]|uniref:Beta-N-acetylglucosaminidase n=1 Tax=Clostridium cavendishii DSM 21758 TaxID=1121302 RepID=A0A1M6GBW1_9CLOT|nr:N-acetylglucosaminidase [Clostridium cavendishii]SHJ07387.1 Beta-N-acetylglucosaminidase [Clostridium cavendishii DSM 21758]
MNRRKIKKIIAITIFSIALSLNIPVEAFASTNIVQNVSTNLQSGTPVSKTGTTEIRTYNALSSIQTKLDTSKVTVYNNVGKADVVIFKDLKAKDIVTIYALDGKTVLGRGIAANAGNLAVALMRQLNELTTKVLVSVKSENQNESEKLGVNYSLEGITAKLDASKAVVYNNVGKADVVIFKDLKAKDIVTIYALDGKTVLGRGTVANAGNLAVALTKQLDESTTKVLVSVKSENQNESQKLEVNYNTESVSSNLDISKVMIYDNSSKADVAIFKGLKAKDVVTIYSADGNTVLGRGTAAKAGDLAVALAKQIDESVLKALVSVKSENQKESAKLEVKYIVEEVTAKLDPTNVTIYNNVGKADVVIFKNLKAKDTVTIYALDGKTVLGRGTATKAGDLAVALTKQLDESALKVLVSVKSDTLKESDMVEANILGNPMGTNIKINYFDTNLTFNGFLNSQMNLATKAQVWNDGLWIDATKDQVSYYLNPNNFINDIGINQFLKLNYMDGITAQDLNSVLVGKGVLEGKGQAFLDAGKLYNVNPVYLVAHSFLETGNGTSKLATGISLNSIHESFGDINSKVVSLNKTVTVYNVYGYGAYDSNPDLWGSEKAYAQGWFTVEQAIIGGAKYISSGYINNTTYNQNTLYKMRWDLTTLSKNPSALYAHEYATDIGWAYKQSQIMKNIIIKMKSSIFYYEVPKFIQ